MTDEKHTDESGEARQRWAEEAREALDRTTKAVRTAWDATRDNRLSALESAKRAAKELGEALERGAEAARERWDEETAEDEQDSSSRPHPGTTDPDSTSPQELDEGNTSTPDKQPGQS